MLETDVQTAKARDLQLRSLLRQLHRPAEVIYAFKRQDMGLPWAMMYCLFAASQRIQPMEQQHVIRHSLVCM